MSKLSPQELNTLVRDLREATDSLWTRAGGIAALVDQQRYAEAENLIPETRSAIQIITLNIHTIRRNTP